MRTLLPALSALLLLAACEGDRCANVVCGAEGTMCSPVDGLCHCGSLDGEACGAAESCHAATGACYEVPAAECGAGTSWSEGTQAFAEGTDAWGLTGVIGARIGAVDFDGDGWTDVTVRNIPVGFEDFGAGGVRHTWLLRNTGDGRFEDVTEASGLLTPRGGASGGRPVEVLAWGDADGDGDLDAYLGVNTVDLDGANQGETSEIMFQDSPGHFALGPDTNGVRFADDIDVPAGAAFVDVDRDGDLDLWVGQHNYTTASGGLRFRQSRLWRNDGTGQFTDATIEAGLQTSDWNDVTALNEGRAHARAWSATAADLNDDGLPELLAASYGRAPNHLFQAGREGDAVTFTNRSVASGYAFDADMTWQDNEFARCYCAANRTAEGCADVPASRLDCSSVNWSHETDRQPFRLGGNSGSTVVADVDNDGDLDLLTTEIKHWWAGSGADGAEILVNTGEADVRFERPGRAAMGIDVPHAGVAWDEGFMTAAMFDFDLDGWTDVWLGGSDYPGNHGLLFHQTSALSFEPVSITDGIDHHRSQGVVVADFDRDGDLDVILGHSRARCGAPDDCYPTQNVRYFENLVAAERNVLQLRLEGASGSNRSAIGARVVVTAGGVTQTHEVEGGHGHYGEQGDLVQTFGLGAACEADVTIRWPDAARTSESWHLTAGHRFHLTQGAAPHVEAP